MDPDDRVFVASLLLAGTVGIIWIARAWTGDLTGAVTWLALGLVALAIAADLLLDTGFSRGVARWLNAPSKGPAGWRGKAR